MIILTKNLMIDFKVEDLSHRINIAHVILSNQKHFQGRLMMATCSTIIKAATHTIDTIKAICMDMVHSIPIVVHTAVHRDIHLMDTTMVVHF